MKSNKLNWFCRLQGNWFCKGKLISQGETGSGGGNWFRRGKLVSEGETGFGGGSWLGNWFRKGKLVLQGETSFAGGNWFLITLAKIFIIILVVKQITYNVKVSDITIL